MKNHANSRRLITKETYYIECTAGRLMCFDWFELIVVQLKKHHM